MSFHIQHFISQPFARQYNEAGEEAGAMEPATCPHCFSTNVKIVGSDGNREAETIRCDQCGRTSTLDVENPSGHTDVLPEQTPRIGPSQGTE